MQHLAGLSRLTALIDLRDAGRDRCGNQARRFAPGTGGTESEGNGSRRRGPRAIGQFPELGTLDLSHTRVTDAGMPALDNLHALNYLVLAYTAVTDDGLAKLTDLPSLRHLTLTGSKVTAQGMARIKKLYPSLTID